MTSSRPRLTFHRMEHGLCAARAGNDAFLAVPLAIGGLRVVAGETPGKVVALWREADFWYVSGHVDDEAAFRAHVREVLAH